ncbi:hypothetical protein SCOR_11890 [Sulfidibacter corallicola]
MHAVRLDMLSRILDSVLILRKHEPAQDERGGLPTHKVRFSCFFVILVDKK